MEERNETEGEGETEEKKIVHLIVIRFYTCHARVYRKTFLLFLYSISVPADENHIFVKRDRRIDGHRLVVDRGAKSHPLESCLIVISTKSY